MGKPQAGVEVKIADDGEVLIKGPNIFQGYYKNADATAEALEDGWLHTGDLGRLDEDGFLYITGRKKDIIITAGGKNITPANLENGLKQSRWISQAVVIGDRRPYLVALITLDPEEAPALAEQLGPRRRRHARRWRRTSSVRAEVQKAIDEVNADRRPGRADQALRDPRPRPVAGDGRADADAEGQAQRRAREVRGRGRPGLRPAPLTSAGGVASNDPTDTGGLFIGRRPGTRPVRYRDVPPSSERRRRADRLLAHGLLAVELVLCLSLFGPQPLAWLWVGSQVDYLTGYVTAGIATVMLGCLASLMLTMAAGKRVDHAWKLVRRAAGHRQERGALERIFATSVAIAAVVFTFWFLIIQGPGPTFAPS